VALKFPFELEFRNVDFCGGRKTGKPGEKPSEQGREQSFNLSRDNISLWLITHLISLNAQQVRSSEQQLSKYDTRTHHL